LGEEVYRVGRWMVREQGVDQREPGGDVVKEELKRATLGCEFNATVQLNKLGQ
jgi:hypothetical protein